MFTTAFTDMEACNWSVCPDTTNPVEHINKDSIPAKEYKKSIWSVLDNISQCDKLAAAKRLAVFSNVTISYASNQETSVLWIILCLQKLQYAAESTLIKYKQ